MEERALVDLPLEQQASLVLCTLLNDIVHENRTFVSVQHHVEDLFALVGAAAKVPSAQVAVVANKVASHGVEMLPGYPKEVLDGAVAQADGSGT